MTVKTVPYQYAARVVERWTGHLAGFPPLDPPPRPEPVVTVDDTLHSEEPWTFTWDPDLSVEDAAMFDRAVRVVRREREPVDNDAMSPPITTLRQWKNRTPGNETQAQVIAVLDAMVELWRLTLKED